MATLAPRPLAQANPASNQWEIIINEIEPEFAPLAEANGNLVQFAKEARFALDIILANEQLQRCPTESIRAAVRNVAAVGLTLNPAMKLAYLVPRNGVCCLDISYRGLLKIAVDSGSVLAAKAIVVRANDPFEFMGPFAIPLHKPDVRLTREQRGEIVACYGAAELPGHTYLVEMLWRDDIEDIRGFALGNARNPDNPNLPWNKWTEEQVKKSGMRRAAKGWPPTERLASAVALLNENDGASITEAGQETVPVIRNGRPDAAAIVAASAGADSGSPERDAFLAALERATRAGGTAYYGPCFKKMSRQQREWLGKEGHERLWQLALERDAAQQGAA